MTTRSFSYTRPWTSAAPVHSDRPAARPPACPDRPRSWAEPARRTSGSPPRLLPPPPGEPPAGLLRLRPAGRPAGRRLRRRPAGRPGLGRAETRAALADPDPPGLHPLVAGAAGSVLGVGADPACAHRPDRRQPPGPAGRTPTPPSTTCSGTAGCPPTRWDGWCWPPSAPPRPERQRWSDAICTGLQLAEHWQDVAEDAAGRTGLPACRGHGPLRGRPAPS